MNKNIAFAVPVDEEDDGIGWKKVSYNKNNPDKKEKKTKKYKEEEKQKKEKRKREAKSILDSGSVFESVTIYQQFEEIMEANEKKEQGRLLRQKKFEEKQERIAQQEKQYQEKIAINYVHTTRLEDEPLIPIKIPKKKVKKEPPKPTYDQNVSVVRSMASQISFNDIQKKLSEWRKKYPQNFDIQLKFLAEYFEKIFSKAPSIIGEYNNSQDWATKDIPISFVPSNIVEKLGEWMEPIAENHIIDFTWFLFDTFLKNEIKPTNDKKINGTGLWTLLQLVVKKFPYALGKIVPKIQDSYMTKVKSGYLLKKPENVYIIEILGYIHQNNPRISLYCWFALLLQTMINNATEQHLCEITVQYIEILIHKYNKKDFKVSENSNYYYPVEDEMVVLIQFLQSNVRIKTIQPRIRAIFQKIAEYTIFHSSTSPSLYFPKILPLVTTEKIEDQTESNDKSSRSMVLHILALSLLKDTNCHSILVDNYVQYQQHTHHLLFHLSSFWDKFTPNINENRLPIATKELIDMCNMIIDINNKILHNKYTKNGKQFGLRALSVTREQLEETNNSCENSLKIFKKTYQQQINQKKKSGSCFVYFIVILLILGTLFSLFYFELIPQKYGNIALSYVPKSVITQVEYGVKFVQEKLRIMK